MSLPNDPQYSFPSVFNHIFLIKIMNPTISPVIKIQLNFARKLCGFS